MNDTVHRSLLRLAACAAALVALAPAAQAQATAGSQRGAMKRAMVATAQPAAQAMAVPGCPNQGGLLDSITVPVGEPLNLSVVIPAPDPNGPVSFNVSSDAPAIVAAGDRVQGFIPTVTVPAGATQSNAFTLYGIAVGQTLLRLTPLSPGYSAGSFPLGAWDVNKSGSGRDQKFLDANALARSCRVPGSGALSTSSATRASCGLPVRGVASDGANALLLRSVSGLAGTACFEIVAPGSDDGRVRTPLIGTAPVSGLNYGFSYYDPPQAYGSSTAANRNVTVEFTFTPSIGNGNTSRLRADLEVVRPPVVLVHGLWSRADAWSDAYRRNQPGQYTTVPADYAATNAASLSVNDGVVREAVASALDASRDKGYAAVQADVVGHSMGGLLTRNFVAAADYRRPDNLEQGDVRRLVTLDTPHWGSSFANLLVSLHAVSAATATRIEQTVTTLTSGGDMTRGAVCDLAENSPALAALAAGTAISAQTITATGGPAGTPAQPAPYWGGVTWFGLNSFERALTDSYCSMFIEHGICIERQYYFPQDRVGAFRFREANDAVVGLASQQGGIGGINFAGLIHFHVPLFGGGITDDDAARGRVFALFDGAAAAFQGALPGVPANGSGTPRTVPGVASNAADYAAGCAAGGPLKPALHGMPRARMTKVAAAAAPDPNIRIVAPAAGSVYTLGTGFDVVIELASPLTEQNTVAVIVRGLGRVEAAPIGNQRFKVALPPLPFAGAYSLVPDVTDTAGRTGTGSAVEIGIAPAAPPTALELVQSQFRLRPNAAPKQLYVQARLADGSKADVSSHLFGTRYDSSDGSIVSVGADGLATIVGSGQAQVTARNGSLSTVATFVVRDPTQPTPATLLTGQFQITRGGLRLDRSSGFYVQQVSVRNAGPLPASVPLYLVLSGLPAGVTLVNKSGLTETLAPLARPYIVVRPGGDGLSLAPGSGIDNVFQFLNPTRANITYTLDVVGGTSTP